MRTLDLPHIDVLLSVSVRFRLVRGRDEGEAHRVLDVEAGDVELLELLLEVLCEVVHGRVGNVVVLSLGQVAAVCARESQSEAQRERGEEEVRTRWCTWRARLAAEVG